MTVSRVRGRPVPLKSGASGLLTVHPSYLLRLRLDPGVADELTQDVMTTLWQKAELFDRSKGRAIAWMIILTRRHTLDRVAASPAPADSLAEEGVMAAVDRIIQFPDPTAAAQVRGRSADRAACRRCSVRCPIRSSKI